MNQDEIILPDGSKYTGELKDGKPHGQGMVIHPNGAQYTGNFANGEPHGHGISEIPGGQKYVGEFKNGKFHGHGTLVATPVKSTFTHGQGGEELLEYVGEFRDNLFHGQGTLTLPGGLQHTGKFINGTPNGPIPFTIPEANHPITFKIKWLRLALLIILIVLVVFFLSC